MSGQVKTGAVLCRDSKREIAQKPLFLRRDKCAFLSALIFSCGSILIHGDKVSVAFSTKNQFLTDAVRSAVESLAGAKCRVNSGGERNGEVIIENALQLLQSCKVIAKVDGKLTICDRISDEFRDSAVAYVRGAYLGSGSLTTGKYHLEVSFGIGTIAEDFAGLLAARGLETKIVERKSRAVVYTKDGQTISDCLALMGAGKAVLELNDIMARRQVSVHVNRQKNCDMYNIDRQVETGVRQCEMLQKLELSDLSPVLIETVEARLKYPDYSYEQLAAVLGITKSGLKNRLRRLTELYKKQGGK